MSSNPVKRLVDNVVDEVGDAISDVGGAIGDPFQNIIDDPLGSFLSPAGALTAPLGGLFDDLLGDEPAPPSRPELPSRQDVIVNVLSEQLAAVKRRSTLGVGGQEQPDAPTLTTTLFGE